MITEKEIRLMVFFAENTENWYSHKRICRQIDGEYRNENQIRKPIRQLQKADILTVKQEDGTKYWKTTKDL